jgi:hypothetical protein
MQLNHPHMNPHPENDSPPERKPLVSVEFQQEVDVSTGRGESRMFVKMYFDARDSGLLREMPADLWQLLCCLSTYMDPAGNCFPSQERIAQDLGIARETVNRKLRRLLAWQFNGMPVIRTTGKVRSAKTQRWASNRYEILPISSLGIFDQTPFDRRDRHVTDPSHGPHVTNSSHGERHKELGTNRHTNENQNPNQTTFNVERESKSIPQPSLSTSDSATAPRAFEQDRASATRISEGPKAIGESLDGYLDKLARPDLSQGELDDLVHRIEMATGDHHSRSRFQAIVQHVPKHVIERLLGDIKQAGADLHNPGAFFEKRIQTECRALEIELPRSRQAADASNPNPPAPTSSSGDSPRAVQ